MYLRKGEKEMKSGTQKGGGELEVQICAVNWGDRVLGSGTVATSVIKIERAGKVGSM